MPRAVALTEFIGQLHWADVPEFTRRRVQALLSDFAAVTCAGSSAPTAQLAADFAVAQHAGAAATVLHDGRRASVTGAAWANGVLANALDFDDGHRLVKGHPGANVIPAALAVAEMIDAPREDVLAAITVGYEIAVRAGIALHLREASYHGSGAWGAVGAAAAVARLLELDAAQTAHALGLAEYHAPMAPIMRSVADPAMTKDACGWGAMTGTSSALLAASGFTASEGAVLESLRGPDSAVGTRWYVEDIYVKAFPCCRWSQPAIAAALAVREAYGIEPRRITQVTIGTFAAAAALSRRAPTTTEEAQYSLVWPVAAALVHGDFGVAQVLPAAFDDGRIHGLAGVIVVEVDPILEAAFPAVRRAAVTVETSDGSRCTSELTEAPGEPDDPGWAGIVSTKFARFGGQLPDRSPLRPLLT
ncbi:MAG: MmgE/PrpD family protein [Actinomycetota bacterium]|nr:MmgE/PrpD family protein [Actinomycetota bacterium]